MKKTNSICNLHEVIPLLFILLVSIGCKKSLEPTSTFPAEVSGLNDNRSASKAKKKDIPEWPVNVSNFVTEITNPYLAFEVGKTFRYEGETDEGTETIIVEVTHTTKTILGVTTTVVHDRVYLEGDLIEDTHDWYAQDKDGNVWYFGEDSKEIEDGEVVSTEGSWEAGVDGAVPGIIMLAKPRIGMKYQQEFYEGVAEDMAKVLSLSETVTIGIGTFTGVLETMDWTPLEPGAREHKFYKPGVGLVLEQSHKHGGQLIELVSVTN